MSAPAPNEESLTLIQSLESTGRAVGGALGAELLVYAADLLRATDRDAAMGDALLVRALQMDPGCRLAVDRTLRSASARGDWLVLADALAVAADLVEPPHAQAVLIAQRAEVVGYWLGRLEEARQLYIDAAERSPQIAAASLAAADDIEARQDGRTSHESPWLNVAPREPAFDPLLSAGMPTVRGPDPALDRDRGRLADGFDPAIFSLALIRALDRGIVDAARRLLPGLSAESRLAELEQLIHSADATRDAERSLRLRAAAFAESPTTSEYYEAARKLFAADPSMERRIERRMEARIDVLLRRRRVVMAPVELQDLLVELAELAGAAGRPTAAAEAYLELLRLPQVQDWAEILASVDQLSRTAENRQVWSRALAAASSRPGLDASARRQLLGELARVLEEELDDAPAATAVRAELALSAPASSTRDGPTVRSPAPRNYESVGPAAIRRASQRGDLPTAVRMLKQADLPASVTYALWQEVAELAEVLGQDELARLAYINAAERATSPSDREVARAGRARVAERTGAKREAAQALLGVASARITARAQLAARDVIAARAAFGRALDQDPTDVEAAAQLARLHAEDGNRRTVDQLADAMASHPMSDDRRSVWLSELALALHRLGDYVGARRDFVRAMRLDVANVDAAAGLVSLGVDAFEGAWIDDGLASLRARWAARGDWMRAFVVAAVLVGRKRAREADRLTYESLRSRFCVQPLAALPQNWVGRWLGLVTDATEPDLPPIATGAGGRSTIARPWRLESGLGDVVSTVQALFRAPEPRWYEDDGPGIRMGEAGEAPVLVVGRGVPRWRRRWRFEVGRALAALVEPRLARGLLPTDGRPTIEQQVVDRAGLVASGDPAVALSAIGADDPRGVRLIPFAVSDLAVEMWRSVGMGIGDLGTSPWPHRPTMM